MKHFTTFHEYEPSTLHALTNRGAELKAGARARSIAGKTLAMIFLNPSLRTRVSFEVAMARFGGHTTTLSPGNDVWALEWRDGAVMNAGRPEHVKDAAQVLGRMCDAIAIRTFGELRDFEADMREEMLSAFRRYSPVPVISMESASEHPCQALADMMTMASHRAVALPTLCVTWAPHIKPLPLAVPHSALLAGAASKMNVVLACPEGYEPSERVLSKVSRWCEEQGTRFSISHNQREACASANFIYAKSWGSPLLYGKPDRQQEELEKLGDWLVRGEHLAHGANLLHCLPVRRNLEVHDEALDSAGSLIYEQAENRLWAQSAMLEWIFSGE